MMCKLDPGDTMWWVRQEELECDAAFLPDLTFKHLQQKPCSGDLGGWQKNTNLVKKEEPSFRGNKNPNS